MLTMQDHDEIMKEIANAMRIVAPAMTELGEDAKYDIYCATIYEQLKAEKLKENALKRKLI